MEHFIFSPSSLNSSGVIRRLCLQNKRFFVSLALVQRDLWVGCSTVPRLAGTEVVRIPTACYLRADYLPPKVWLVEQPKHMGVATILSYLTFSRGRHGRRSWGLSSWVSIDLKDANDFSGCHAATGTSRRVADWLTLPVLVVPWQVSWGAAAVAY